MVDPLAESESVLDVARRDAGVAFAGLELLQVGERLVPSIGQNVPGPAGD